MHLKRFRSENNTSDGDSQDSMRPWRKNKRILASLMSIIAGRFILPQQALASPEQAMVKIDVSSSTIINRNDGANKFSDSAIVGTGSTTAVAAAAATGAIVVGGLVLRRKKDKETQDEKKRKFDEIIGVQKNDNTSKVLKKFDRKTMKTNVKIEPSNSKSEVPKKGNGDHTFKPPLSPAKSKTAAKLELEEIKASMKAKSVARTIAEATERSKLEREVQDEKEGRKASIKAKAIEKVLSEAKRQRESKSINQELQVDIPPLPSRGMIESSDRFDKSQEKVYYSVEGSENLEEYAFQILLDLGLVELSRDPDSNDYDHTDDNDVAR